MGAKSVRKRYQMYGELALAQRVLRDSPVDWTEFASTTSDL